MLEWKAKQEALAAKGLDSKTVTQLAVDCQRNNDWTGLKALEAPFTTAADVDDFVGSGLPESDQNIKEALCRGELRYKY